MDFQGLACARRSAGHLRGAQPPWPTGKVQAGASSRAGEMGCDFVFAEESFPAVTAIDQLSFCCWDRRLS